MSVTHPPVFREEPEEGLEPVTGVRIGQLQSVVAFTDAGYHSIRIEKQGLPNTAPPDPMHPFEMAIPAFLDYMRSRTTTHPDNVRFREAYEWFRDNIDAMHESFTQKGFFSVGFMSFTARR